MRHCLNVNRLEIVMADDTNAFVTFVNGDTHLTHFENQWFIVLWNCAFNEDITSSDCCSNHERSRLNSILNNCMIGPVKFRNALNTDLFSSSADNFSPHLVQDVCQINDFRFPGGILNHRAALCQSCCHHNILGSTDTWEVQINLSTMQSLGSICLNIAIMLLNRCTQCFKAL